MLHAAGSSQLEVSAAAGNTCGDTTTVLALANNSSPASPNSRSTGLMIFLSNTGRGNCSVTLAGLPSTDAAFLYKIDSDNGNPYGVWQSMGSPPFPTPSQIAKLQAESSLRPLKSAVAGQMLFGLEPNALQVLVI